MKSSILKKISLLGISFLSIFTIVSCKGQNSTTTTLPSTSGDDIVSNEDGSISNKYSTTSKVGYDCEYLGTVKRTIPSETNDEGYVSIGYPTYGETLSAANTEELRSAIIDESNYLTTTDTSGAGGGGYNRLDKDGYLYLNNDKVLDTNGKHRKLYKHTASIGMYEGDVSDSEEAIIKKITFSYRGFTNGYGITGVYAPAGEVLKVEISASDMDKTEGITIHIGQALFNGQCNNIWSSRDLVRMPHLLNTFQINKSTAVYNEKTDTYTAYIGSYLGGAVYVRNETDTFSVTISGGVRYSHFILGYTTQEEFEQNSKSSAPYFDLEVCENGVLHSGPKNYAKDFSYDDLYNVAVLWDKIANISTQYKKQGIVFLYDPFVAAGDAVAFPGRNSVNCPCGWMTSSLDYNSFVESGSWGNIHEYNHNFQGYGLGDGGEVTNNALSLVAYSQHTQVSAKRQIGTYNENLSDWNMFTSPTWTLRDITDGIYNNGQKGLSIYATFLHGFGPEVYMNAVCNSNGEGIDNWFNACMNASGYDMTYFFNELIGYDVSQDTLNNAKSKGYSMFVPVSSVYQTGRSYIKDGKTCYTETSNPYRISYGKSIDIDLSKYTFDENKNYVSGSVVIPDGFTYNIKKVSTPTSGTLTKKSDMLYTYTPGNDTLSGKIYIELEITKNDGLFKVDNIELVLEFEQTHELDKNVITRTVYQSNGDTIYTSASQAFEASYSGYTITYNGINDNTFSNGKIIQDCSAEVWLESVNNNEIIEISGKYKIDEAGKYRFALRGRYNVCLYISVNGGNTYSKAAEYTNNTNGSPDFPLTEGTYSDYSFEENSWVYFKAVMICSNNNGKNAFIGVGMGKFDLTGNVSINKVNAYKENYENLSSFTSDYTFERTYTYDYIDNTTYTNKELISIENYAPWSSEDHIISNLTDGDYSTYIHTNWIYNLETNPLTLTLDLGEVKKSNRIILYTQQRSDPHYPKEFTLYGSLDNQTFTKITDFTDVAMSNGVISLDYEETSFRYYKLVITKSSNQYIILGEIEIVYANEIVNGTQVSLDKEEVKLYGNWNINSGYSTFGHYYEGNNGDTFKFEFEGNRFGILSSSNLDNIEVYIDNVLVSSIELSNSNDLTCKYISSLLSNGTHIVEIKCNGNATIDSLVYWEV